MIGFVLVLLALGGFDSIPRRDRRRAPDRRHREARRGLYRRIFGGGIESWFAYAVALVFLLIAPSGLFGQKLVERV